MTKALHHALIVHGLNNSHEAMRPIQSVLEAMGIGTTSVQLTGHHETEDRTGAFKRVTAEHWLTDVGDAYRGAVLQNPPAKIILVANSLGALLGLTLAQTREAQFEKMVLFAPALFLRPWSYFPRLFSPFNFSLPSGMPAHVRANAGTPIAAYRALFSLVKNFNFAFQHAPALVIMDPRDELVAYGKVRSWSQQNAANRFLSLRSPGRFKHLLTAQEFTGPANWASIVRTTENFIAHPTTRDNA